MPNPSPTFLSNSAFSSLNLFPPTPTHVPSKSSPYPKPTLHRSITPRQSPSIPIRNSSIISDTTYSSPNTPDLSYYTDHSPRLSASQTSSAPITPTTLQRSFVSLNSSSIQSQSPMSFHASPQETEVAPVRRGRFVENFQEEDSKPQVIFGQSAQRTRRMRKPVALNLIEKPLPSPTLSSDEDPLPITPASHDMFPSRSWSVTSGSGLTGLGVQGIKDFEEFKSSGFALPAITEGPIHDLSLTELNLNSESSLSLHLPVELSSPALFSSAFPTQSIPARRRRPCPHRLLSSSQSLNSFAAPSNLAELRQLQQAAVDMEHEAKRPCMPLPRESEKRVRRKVVPVLSCEDYIGSSSQASGSGTTQSYTLEVAHSAEMSQSSSASSISSFGDSPIMMSQSATLATLPISHEMTPTRSALPSPPRESPMRRFYGNAVASMSMIDISPRKATLPISTPPRESKIISHQRATSGPTSQGSPSASVISGHDDGSSDSGDSFDQPLTPNSFNSGLGGRVGGNGFQFGPSPSAGKAKKAGGGIYGNKSAFMSQLDLGLKRVMDRRVDNEEDGKKSKKGFGRFLGMRA